MSLWETLPWTALVASVGALVAAVVSLRRPAAGAVTRRLLIVAAAALALAFFFLMSRFIALDFGYEYVFLYTGEGLALRWRIAGTWAGRQGSLLLWTMYLAIATAVLAWRWRPVTSRGVAATNPRTSATGMEQDAGMSQDPNRAPTADPPHASSADPQLATARTWTLIFLSAFLAAFAAAVVAQHTFRATPDLFLQGRPGGNGLNPTLKSQFILIHPPLMFMAYALTTVPAAAALGHLVSGTNLWSRISAFTSRVDWLLYTFAMGLGGLWAYYTLGFGGYWAWDPVEVANLLPWLALTVYLHAQLHHLRYGAYRTVGPFLAMLPFLLTIFSAISTRSGLWVSVHAFTDPTNTFNPDSPARFMDILGVEPGLHFYISLWLGSLALFLALWTRRLAIEHGCLGAFARVAGALFAAFAAVAIVAPETALGLLFEASALVTGGRTGVGLLVIAFGSVLVAAAPALWSEHDEPARARRLDLRSLAYYSVVILGLSLLLLFLFHMASSNGWSTRFYLDRVPWIATPIILGLIVLQGHGVYGRVRSLQLATVTLAAALVAALVWPEHRGGAYLTTLAAVLAVVSLDRVRRVAVPAGTPPRVVTADSLLLVAALLNVAFWFNPPSRVLGPLDLHLTWPVQVPMGALALYGVWASHRILAGAPPARPWHVHVVVGALGAYYVAPVLATAAYILRRRQPLVAMPLGRAGRARMHQVGLYGLHFAVAIAIVGYAPSSHLSSGVEQEVLLGETAALGPYDLRFTGTEGDVEAGTPFLRRVLPIIQVEREGKDVGRAEGILRWEPSADAHFPLPSTVRLWERDLFVSIDAVHAAEGSCGGERWIEAYQGANPPRLCSGDPIDAIRIDAVSLPMLSFVWAALFLFLFYMTLVIVFDPRRPQPAAPALRNPLSPPG